jgi:ribonuclease VapC
VIFIDTSAIVAILAAESDGPEFATKLEQAADLISAPHVILEASMRLSTLLGLTPSAADEYVTRLLRDANAAVVPITEDIAHAAVIAFERYGKGQKRAAKLNFSDCLSYACASAHGAALLFKGRDFLHTDIAGA